MTQPAANGPPRVLQVVISLNPGGTERLVVEIARRVRPAFVSSVCCLDESGKWSGQLTSQGIPVSALHRPPGFRPAIGRRLAGVARQAGATILHCHQYSPFVYGCVAALWNPGLRVVFTEHGRRSDQPPRTKQRVANHVLGRLGHRMFAVSEELRQFMAISGFPRKRLRVIYNGIDPGLPPAPGARAAARARLGLPEEAFVVGTVARLDPVKDLATLVHGFAAARSSRADARLVLVGDGPERGSLERVAKSADMGGSTTFLGERSDPREILPAFDVYVNSSVTEGVSITILEAMAAFLPVVATSVGGTPEVIGDHREGLLVPARSPQALARALAELACAPVLREQLGAAARRRVLERFTVDRMVAEYLDVYRACAGRSA
jgi:glycosyltransferase involved in cell wall biosynthesis